MLAYSGVRCVNLQVKYRRTPPSVVGSPIVDRGPLAERVQADVSLACKDAADSDGTVGAHGRCGVKPIRALKRPLQLQVGQITRRASGIRENSMSNEHVGYDTRRRRNAAHNVSRVLVLCPARTMSKVTPLRLVDKFIALKLTANYQPPEFIFPGLRQWGTVPWHASGEDDSSQVVQTDLELTP